MLALSAMVLLGFAQKGHPPQLTGAEIIRRLEAVYANLKSYSDTGEMVANDERITFQTEYKSPGKFRFQYSEESGTWTICGTGKQDSKESTPKKPVWLADSYFLGELKHETLEMAVAGFTGVSRGTAYTVPSMLFGGLGGRMFHNAKNPKRLRSEQVNGRACYVVKTDQETIYVEPKTFALLKVVETLGGDTDTTTYKPILSPKVADSVFVFKAPKG